MARELMYTGHDLPTCIEALEKTRDDLDRASMWLLGCGRIGRDDAGVPGHEEAEVEREATAMAAFDVVDDDDPAATAARREGYAAL